MVFVQVGMVVGIAKMVLSRILEVVATISPRVCDERSFARKVSHAANRRLLTSPSPWSMVAPIVIVGINVCTVDIVQFVGLEVIGRKQLYGLLGKGMQVGVQLGYPAL